MRPSLRFALFFAGLWIAIKLVFMAMNIFQENIQATGLINNFFLLLAISLGLYFGKKKEGFGVGTALSDIKHGVTAGAVYTVLVSAFIFFYYDSINPEFVQKGIEERMDMVYKDMERPSYVDSLKMHRSDFQTRTDEEILREAKKEIESNLAPKSMLTFSLLGMLIMTVTYSILVTLIYRKVLFKDWYKGS